MLHGRSDHAVQDVVVVHLVDLFALPVWKIQRVFNHRDEGRCWSGSVRVLLVVCVPSRPVAELSQQLERSFSRNIHLGLHLETQHGLVLQGVQLNLATVQQAEPSALDSNRSACWI